MSRAVAIGQAFVDRLATMDTIGELEGVLKAFAVAQEIPTPEQRAAMATRRAEILKSQAKRNAR